MDTMLIRQEGRIANGKNKKYRKIIWSGLGQDRLKPDQVPPGFYSLPCGQQIEAMVIHDYRSFKTIGVETWTNLPKRIPLTFEERQDLWDSIGSSRDLPSTTWD